MVGVMGAENSAPFFVGLRLDYLAMQPPIPSPHGDSIPPRLSESASPPRSIAFFIFIFVLGVACCGVATLESVLIINSLRNGPFPVPPIQETILWLAAGLLLFGVGIRGMLSWRRRASR